MNAFVNGDILIFYRIIINNKYFDMFMSGVEGC